MTLGILATAGAQEARWGWWSLEDSLVVPTDPETDGFEDLHGGIRASLGTDPARAGTRATLATDLRRDGFGVRLGLESDSTWRRTRQTLAWTGRSGAVEAGDLGTWPEEPLLEGRCTGSSAGGIASILGSGHGLAGVDLSARSTLVEAPLRGRARIAPDSDGRARISALAGLGVLRAGALVPSAAPERSLGLVGAHLEVDGIRLEASHLGAPRDGAWRASLEASNGSYAQRIDLLHAPSRALHDRMPSLPPGTTSATIASRWRGTVAEFELQSRFQSDSVGVLSIHSRSSASVAMGDQVRLRLRSRFSRTRSGDRGALVPGIARDRGRLRPWAELTLPSDRPASVATGVRWLERFWTLQLSARRTENAALEGSASSTLHGRGHSLELETGLAAGGPKGAGTWSMRW